MRRDKRFTKFVINLVGGSLAGLGSAGTLIFLKDRHKQLLQEMNQDLITQDNIDQVGDDKVKTFRSLSKDNFKNIGDNELKRKVAELEIENERRDEFFKELEDIRNKNKLD